MALTRPVPMYDVMPHRACVLLGTECLAELFNVNVTLPNVLSLIVAMEIRDVASGRKVLWSFPNARTAPPAPECHVPEVTLDQGIHL